MKWRLEMKNLKIQNYNTIEWQEHQSNVCLKMVWHILLLHHQDNPDFQ